MNLQSTQTAKPFIKKSQMLRGTLILARLTLFVAVFFVHVSVKAWDVDLSRRSQDLKKLKVSGPAPVETLGAKEEKSLLSGVFSSLEPVQEIVVLNTEKGFVPENLQLRVGGSYKIHVVNVNEKERNVSFILDAFAEHHGTYFGQPQTFELAPKVEGIFSFQCPETAKQGRIVVAPVGDSRRPASAN